MASTKTNLVGRQDNILLEACYKNVCQQYSRDVAALPRQ